MQVILSDIYIKAFPAIYSWTTYPLTCVLEKLYEEATAMEREPNPSLVELTAVVERSINYMHTGNAAVISTSVMNPLWIGLSVIYDGLPCFNGTILNIRNPSHGIVNFGQWPFDERNQRPKTASKSGLLHNYGPAVFNVSFLFIDILKSRHCPVYTLEIEF